MADAIPRVAMVIIEACGHLATLEQPETLTALLRYWLQVGRGRNGFLNIYIWQCKT